MKDTEKMCSNQDNINNAGRSYSYSINRTNELGMDIFHRDSNLHQYETESLHFLQDVGLIPNIKQCLDCNSNMRLHFSEWTCTNCGKNCPIQSNSLLGNISCSYDKLLGILSSWCNCKEIERTAVKLGVESETVSKVYSLAGQAAEKHIMRDCAEWKIGGPGIIVLIDTFPESLLEGDNHNSRPILCLAELKGHPLTILFHPLELKTEQGDQLEIYERMKSKCHSFISNFVHPESVVVARRNAILCSYEDILANQPQFKIITSNEGLSKHETEGRSLHTILSTIWEKAIYICMEAQYYPHHLMKSFLFSHMWNRKFGFDAYPSILEEISSMVNPSS